ncbi:MAG: DUF4296 domain-containing protein [Bacteroidales bacterium]|nr:DUF4296 domain-containing protein [Bacteroidales bacterium]
MESKIRIILVFLTLFSCTNNAKQPPNIIPKDTLVDILIDMHLCDALLNINEIISKYDSIKATALYLSVLKKYKINKERFLKTIDYYSDNPNLFNKIYEQAIEKLEDMRNNEIDTLKQNL